MWHQNFYPFDRSDVGEEKTKRILKIVFPRDSAMTLAEKFKIVQKELGENFNHRDLRNLLKTDIQVGKVTEDWPSWMWKEFVKGVHEIVPHFEALEVHEIAPRFDALENC